MKQRLLCGGRLIKLMCWLVISNCLCRCDVSTAAMLDTHTVVLDPGGEIIPWTSDPGQGYDRVMFLSWDLLLNRIHIDPANGLPAMYTHSEYDPNALTGENWPNNPAGKNAMLADSAIMYYPYSGNSNVLTFVRGLLNHHLQHGTTPTNYNWAGVPYSTAASGSTNYGNDDYSEGVGVLEPDKVGELGYYGYLRFYELTGETNYLNAAIRCADQLAQHIRTGNATNSPWPFRVVAQTGATSQSEEYCADVVAPIRLFDELVRLGLGSTNSYQNARQTAWTWLMTYPMANQVWVNYFEDVKPRPNKLDNENQYCPGETARYLLEHPELDTNWLYDVTNLLGYIEINFGGTDYGEPGLQYGAHVISEQDLYKYKMASHTSRFAADYALLYSLTGDTNALETAYRSLNWCTYMCRSNGVVIEGPAEFTNDPSCWFTDGHGDYVRHFMLALRAVPEWAPAGQNHITGSTTVIKSVSYDPGSNSISYTTFDNGSTESLRLAFTPVGVFVDGMLLPPGTNLAQPGWVFNASNGVLRVRHDTGNNVQIFSGSALVAVTNGVPITNTLPASLTVSGHSFGYYSVTAPANADYATNTLVSATLPVNLWFNQNGPPNGTNPPNYELLGNLTNGISVVSTSTIPQLAPGLAYYLGVENTNSTNVTIAFAVDFHLPNPITGPGIMATNINGTNGFLVRWSGPTNYQYAIQWKTNLAPVFPWHTVVSPVINVTNVTAICNYSWLDDGLLTGGWPLQKFYQVVGSLPPVLMTDSTPFTNGIHSGAFAQFEFNVPTNATSVTNLLVFASGPVNVYFNQASPPTGNHNSDDVPILSTITNGVSVLTGLSAPPLVPGTTCYLGLQNPGTSNVSFVFQVTFGYDALPTPPPSISSITTSNLNGTNAAVLHWVAPTNYQFQVQWATSLEPASAWHTISNVVLTWSGVVSPTNAVYGVFQFLDNGSLTGGFGPWKFYRLIEYPYSTPIPQALTIINTAIIGNTVRFQWVAPTNYSYQVLWTTNPGLPMAGWSVLANPVLGLSNGVYTFIDTNQTGPPGNPKFFRLLEVR